MNYEVDYNYIDGEIDIGIDNELGNKKFEEMTEVFIDESGKEVRIVYFDENYHVTTKDKAFYKQIIE